MELSNMIMGCMRLNGLSLKEAEYHIAAAVEEGINVFDHADIYGGGECETLFSRAAAGAGILREQMILQSKCSIREGYYDFSGEYILGAVDGILTRLNTDYLDILLLHRPDALANPEETAEALEKLKKSGKVRYFGVSNQNPGQIELLQKYFGEKLLFNQLQFGLGHTLLVDGGMAVNTCIPQAQERTGEILEYCRLKDITIQAWSPFQKGLFEGTFLGNQQYAALNEELSDLSKKYGVTPAAIAVAWITRHPAEIQVILGTTKAERLKEECRGADIPLTRKEWYDLYRAAGNRIL